MITGERRAIASAVLHDQSQKIEALQQELRQINKDSLEQIKKMGFEGKNGALTPLLSIVHPHLLELNVSNLSPEDAEEDIMNHIKSLLREKA